MSTRTRPRHRSTASTRRFAKPGTTPQGRRTTTTGRARALNVGRRKPPDSTKDKALGALTGLLGGKKAASGGSKGAKAGAGLAAITAAGLALKNRDKLMSMLKRDGGAPDTDASRPPADTTGAQVHPVMDASPRDLSVNESTRTPSSLDPHSAAPGGIAGSGTAGPLADPTGTQSPYVSPDDPGTEERPGAHG